ncbi:hypothetical protein ANO14919_003700 [Xylariales sp. No.14919]|nr:hypothetical protein ANO14919_003700 [Xylariales sp. No.14919]
MEPSADHAIVHAFLRNHASFRAPTPSRPDDADSPWHFIDVNASWATAYAHVLQPRGNRRSARTGDQQTQPNWG